MNSKRELHGKNILVGRGSYRYLPLGIGVLMRPVSWPRKQTWRERRVVIENVLLWKRESEREKYRVCLHSH